MRLISAPVRGAQSRKPSHSSARGFTIPSTALQHGPHRAEMYNGMSWLLVGVVYSIGYAVASLLLQHSATMLSAFRAGALLVVPAVAVIVIVRRRRIWTGCHWLFWSTIALGLATSAIGLAGWATEDVYAGRQSWLAWPAVFVLFGNIAPLFALLAQPHRGTREQLAATFSVDIAGLAVVTGFLYSFFVTGSVSAPAGGLASTWLLVVSELQAGLVAAGLIAASLVSGSTDWGPTYRRLALGALVGFAALTLSNVEAMASSRSAFVYDLTWILPFSFFAWAASRAPSSAASETVESEREEFSRPRPWVIFISVALLPVIDYVLRRAVPLESTGSFRDLSSAVAIVSVLPLIIARVTVERAELRRAGDTTRLLAEVIEQAQDCILVLTSDGRFRHANEAFCRATGFSRGELNEMQGSALLPRDDPEGHAGPSIRPGGVWRGTLTRTKADGTSFPVVASVASVVDVRNASYIVSVERDISEERRLKEHLIHSERLSAVGQLVAGMAHELNNPLQTVMGIAELLIQSEADEAVRHDIEQIRAGGQRAAHIVRSLLSFVHRSTSERSMADLNEIVRSTLEFRTYELRRASIALSETYAEPAPLVVVSREEIQQIILNVIMNAEQAIRSAGRHGTIHVATGGGDDCAFVDIADDGPGVPEELRGRIFEPFFTTKQIGNGTGLGLSISLGIAETHGGSLTLVRSERGACFRLTLPSLPRSIRSEMDLGGSDAIDPLASPAGV